MNSMHTLLKRQLKRHLGDPSRIPPEMQSFLNAVNEAYRESDADREMLEHSLELSSQELLDANSEMQAVFDVIPDLVFRLNQQGIILDIEAGATGDLASRREDLIGKRIQDTPLKDVARQFAEAIQRVNAESAPVSIEYSAVLQGQESDYEARLAPLPGKQIVVIIRNITERKQSLRLLGSAVEQSTDSIVITDAELDLPGPRILFVNPAFTRMTGYTAAEVLGKTPRILQGPKSDRATLRRLRETLGRGETFAGESVNYRKDGTEFHMEWHIAPIRNAGGKITHFVAGQRDITKRKQTEMALRESEGRNRALFEGSADGIVIADSETKKFRYANPALCRMLGYTEVELQTLGVLDIHPQDALQHVLAEFEAQARGDKILAADLPCLRKDGTVFYADINATKITIDGRSCNVGFFRDITGRQRAEAARLAGEKQIRELNVLQGLLLHPNPLEHKLKLVTEAVVQIMGADFARIWMIAPGDRCATGCVHAQVTEGPHVCRFRERCLHLLASSGRYTHTDGGHGRVPFGCYKIGKIASGEDSKFLTNDATNDPRVHHHAWAKELGLVAFAGYRLVASDGAPLGVLALFSRRAISAEEDLLLEGIAYATSQVLRSAQAEAALRQSEERFRQFADQSSEVIWFTELNPERILFVNRMVEKVWGLPAERFYQDARTWVTAIHPEDRPRVHEAWEACLQGRAPKYEAEYRVVRPDGSIRWVLDGGMPVRNDAGEIVRLSGVARDITERKQAEEALRMFQFASDQAADTIFWLDQNAGFYYVNDQACRSLGYTREELMRLSLFDIDPFFPREKWEENWKRFRDRQIETIRMESRQRRKDGSVFPIEVIVKHSCFGGTELHLAFARDMTERKRMEEALRMYQFASDNAVDEIFWLDENAGFYYVNDQACRSLGYTREELMRLRLFDIDPIFPKERWEETWKKLENGQIETFRAESCHRRKDGSVFPIEVMAKHICLGNLKLLLAVTRDMTERKRMEAELTYERDLFQTLMDQSPDSIYYKDLQSRFLRFSQSKVKRGLAAELARHTAAQPNENPPDHLASEERYAEYLVGKTDFDLFAEAHARPAFEDEQEIIRTGVPLIGKVEKEVWLDGRETWALTSKMPFRNDDGQIVGTFGVSKDITAMKQAEAKLAREQARLQFVFKNMPVGAALARHYPDGRIERIINDAHLKICGLTREQDQIPGIYKQISHPEDYARQAELGRPLDDGRDGHISMEKRYVRLDGEVVWVVYSFQRHHYDDGSFEELTTVTDITELKRAEASLGKTSALLETLLQNTTDHIYFKDLSSRFVHFSQSLLGHFQLTRPDELEGKTDFDFFSEEHARPAFDTEQEIIRTGQPVFNLEEKETHRDGRVTWVLTSKMPWRDKAGNVIGTMGLSRDITERKRMEDHLFQSQKMETVGKLAGGVAHEFNSILTAIIGQSEMLIQDLPPGDPLSKNVVEIRQAADRAATLTRQLLAYGRKQLLRPEALNLNHILASMDGMLRHLVGEKTVQVNIIPALDLHLVKADAGQIEQVIMNLVINAHEAMPNGGKLTLETANVTFDAESVGRNPELKPGDYVLLAISDTGRGMSEEVKARVFEPFFTTKDVGQGPGLGLATSYGIIKQSGGQISVYSEPGRGTTLKIYLPQVELPAQPPRPRLELPDLPHGTETILLVEDDPALREMVATLLKRLGYTVLVAANGLEALSLKQQPDIGHVDLLFTDVVMPHMSGKELADRVRALFPHTRILFTSAYTENAIVHQGVLDKGLALLQKPFTPSALAGKVRAVLDQPNP